MALSSRHFVWPLVILTCLISVTGCQKKSAGAGGSAGGDSGSTTAVDTAQTGAIAVNPVADPVTTASGDPTPEPTPEEGGQLTLTAAPMSQKIPLRPAALVGTLAISLTTPTDLEAFEEGRYVWNPAQVPLDELNKIVCVLSKSGFHLKGDKGKYIAKILLDDCFKAQTGAAANVDDNNKKSLPADVLVDAKTAGDGVISLDVWFTRAIEGTGTHSSPGMMDIPIWQPFEKLEMNYFVRATITETPSNVNPFGIFDMRWEMTIKIDGDDDAKPYQQGYVTTSKENEKVSLKYNQRNWNYDDQQCRPYASARYHGVTFEALNEGSTLNGTTLTFNGTDSITTVLTNAGVASSVVAQFNDQYVMPAGSLTLMGGVATVGSYADYDSIRFTATTTSDLDLTVNAGNTVQNVLDNYSPSVFVDPAVDRNLVLSTGTILMRNGVNGSVASATSNGITFSTSVTTGAVNGVVVTFDGVKSIAEVKAAFYNAHNLWIEPSYNNNAMVLPAGTATLAGGVTRTSSSITVSTPQTPAFVISTSVSDGARMNGFKVRFDGVTSIADTFADIKWPVTGMNVWSFNLTGFATEIPDAGVFEFTGGTGPATDVWASIREFSASAGMDLVTGKPVRGKAHTAENWSRENVTNYCSFNVPNWTPKPVSYGLVFDKFDKYPGHQLPANTSDQMTYPGRAAVKQFSDYVASTAVAGFDPDAMRCEQMGGELANVWQYELFTDAGEMIDYQTNFPLYLEGSTNSWGDGWASEWGINIWGTVNPGDRAYIKNKDGSKRWFDIVKFDGVLRDDTSMPVNNAQSSGTVSFTCDQYCPEGTITADMMNNRWDPAYFLYNEEYVFDYASKKLYRDIDKDGDSDVHVTLGSGVQGWFEVQMKLKSDSTKQYRYALDSWSSEIALKEGEVIFTVPKSIQFDTSKIYTSADYAYPGSEVFNAAHDNAAFSSLISGDKLKFEYGNVCCFDWEQKSGIKDQWGNNSYGQKVVLKKGARLTIDPGAPDPDGSGPLAPGMTLRVAPAFTELLPISKTDCSADLETALNGIQAALPLPGPLAVADRNIKAKIGARPTGTHPVLIINGEAP